MGKMKELFMRIHYPNEDIDLEREYLLDDMLAQEQQYEEFLKLQNNSEMNTPFNSKIEVANGTKIEVSQKESTDNQ